MLQSTVIGSQRVGHDFTTTPHLVLGALCPPWSHPHPPHPHQHCPLRPQSNTECGFLLFSFSLWRDLIPEQPTLSCVMPAPHSMVPPLLATTLPCTPSKMLKRDQHMLMDRTGGGSRSGGGNCETLSLLRLHQPHVKWNGQKRRRY